MSNDKFFYDNNNYISEYLNWIDNRIKSIYNIKNQNNNSGPLKGLIVSKQDIEDIVDNNQIDKDNEYNVLGDSMFELLEQKTALSLENGIELYLEKLCDIFNLNKVEKIFILLALAVEISPKYEKIFGYFNDNINKIRPTINFAISLLGIDNVSKYIIRESFFDNSLFKTYLLHYSFGSQDLPLFSNEIRLDNRIVNYLFGINEVDNDIKDAVEIINFDVQTDMIKESNAYKTIKKIINDNTYSQMFICLYGEMGIGKKEHIKFLCKNHRKNAIIVNLKLFNNNAYDFKINMLKVIREAMLLDYLLVFDNYNEIIQIDDIKLRGTIENIFYNEIDRYNKNVFILSNEALKVHNSFKSRIINIELEKPDYLQKIDIWNYFMKKFNISDSNSINGEDCATKFDFTPLQIKNAVLSYKIKLNVSDKSNKESSKLIYESCFEQVNHNLYKRASRVNINYSWEQLVLPKEQKSLLLDACHQVENKYKVYDDWGFSKTVAYGKGVTIVCSGPPGTGKTMSAQVLANKLNLELFKIDLSQIVSKYVGETEKNLNEIFKEAKVSNAILFFDEADALFGKRSEVKSSNDRYSNLETSYLLQKIEEYEGVSMLATNYLKNIDDAFIRRMKYIINFPFPDVATRKEIWKITIPKQAPISNDIDFDFLAETFELSGGNIKNILVYAAFLSAAEKSKINMRYILKATQYEMQKIGKLVLGQELKQYRHLIEE